MWCGERKIGYCEITAGDISKSMLFLINSKTSSGKDYTSKALNKIRSGISFLFANMISQNWDLDYLFLG